jgi:hypothetical protein
LAAALSIFLIPQIFIHWLGASQALAACGKLNKTGVLIAAARN